MGFPCFEDKLDTIHCEALLSSVGANLPKPPISTTLFLNSKEKIPIDYESDEEKVLPDKAVSLIFSYLPVKDVFRFGFKLSRTWLELWKKIPLVLHDAQLLPDLAKEKIAEGGLVKFNIADKITSILDMHPGPVEHFRVEYTTWKGDNAQLLQWLDKVTSKGVRELVLFGRWPRADLDILPNNIVRCPDLRNLTLCFFKMPDLAADEEFFLSELQSLVLAGCEMRAADISIMLLKCYRLEQFALGHVNEEYITICSETLSSLKM